MLLDTEREAQRLMRLSELRNKKCRSHEKELIPSRHIETLKLLEFRTGIGLTWHRDDPVCAATFELRAIDSPALYEKRFTRFAPML